MSGTTVSVFPEGAAARQGTRAGVVSRLGAMVIDLVYVGSSPGGGLPGRREFQVPSERPHRSPGRSPPFDEILLAGAVVVVLMLTIAWSVDRAELPA